MKLINPSYKILEQEPGLEGIYKQIELAGRTCYKSEDKITEGSAKEFVDKMIKAKHYAMLEHGTVYLTFLSNRFKSLEQFWVHIDNYNRNPYSKVLVKSIGSFMNRVPVAFVTTNYRVLIENELLNDLIYLREPTEYHIKRHTVVLITNIGVSREGNRHRANSTAEQSTRYCNYMKEKFGMSVTYCPPKWFEVSKCAINWSDKLTICKTDADGSQCLPEFYFKGNKDSKNSHSIKTWNAEDFYIFACQVSEFCYENLIKLGKTPQEARAVLNLSTATEVVYTAFDSDWEYFFNLRSKRATTGKPHPDMEHLVNSLMKEMYSKYIYK